MRVVFFTVIGSIQSLAPVNDIGMVEVKHTSHLLGNNIVLAHQAQ
jgi:hypothetical protein